LSDEGSNFAFIAPNLWHDGHGLASCGNPDQLTRDYDALIETTIGLIRASPHWTERSVIVITFDEAAGGKTDQGGNDVATVVVSKYGGPAMIATPMNRYALLATIEDAFHLPSLRQAQGAPNLMDLFDRPCR
jgi:hypothetical protein